MTQKPLTKQRVPRCFFFVEAQCVTHDCAASLLANGQFTKTSTDSKNGSTKDTGSVYDVRHRGGDGYASFP